MQKVHRLIYLVVTILMLPASSSSQTIQVNPTGVNVDAQGSTVVFLTFGSLLTTQTSAEGCWCGDLVPAVSAVGLQCNPAKIYGCLPSRFDLSTRSGIANRGLTDIMSIPPSVARRAYQAAVDGEASSFFYVRRFTDSAGGPDQYVNVTCRLSGGGARSPFALTDVKLAFAVDKNVLLANSDEPLPEVTAEIAYNGSGSLKGRWEVVLPGEEHPSDTDLLTEATLPIEERANQRRYTQLSTFNVFLPPGGRFTLHGPPDGKLPRTIKGEYLVLLRIESTDDKEGDSNLAVVGVGAGVVHSGAVAGFPLPVLRYYVGGGPLISSSAIIELLSPDDKVTLSATISPEFSWSEHSAAHFYRLEIVDGAEQLILAAVLNPTKRTYRAPPWFRERLTMPLVRWRVVGLDRTGVTVSESPWRAFRMF